VKLLNFSKTLGTERGRVLAVGRWLGWCWLAALLPLVGRAFPPAPHYSIYGVVRDQVGATLQVEGAELILLRNGIELGRTPVFSQLKADFNYELKIPIDQSRPATRTYSEKAVPANGLYSLVVVMNGEKYYPINASGNLQAGSGGERVRLARRLPHPHELAAGRAEERLGRARREHVGEPSPSTSLTTARW
jgi:hypothetical protein